MKRLLITGASGFVGQNLARYYVRQGYHVTALHRTTPIPPDLTSATSSHKCDICDFDALKNVFSQNPVDVVLHAAGNKDVKYCETHSDKAYEINAVAARNVARCSRDARARMVYISTDLVFPCTDGWYRETDSPRSRLVYGKTKFEGERLVLEECNESIICRSGGIYGVASPLLRWLDRQLVLGQNVEAFSDVFNTPTFAWNLAEMIEAILQKGLHGIFHTVGPQRTNRFDFFRAYAREMSFNPDLVVASEAGDRKEKLLLRADASLSSESTRARLDLQFDDVTRGLRRLKLMGGIDAMVDESVPAGQI